MNEHFAKQLRTLLDDLHGDLDEIDGLIAVLHERLADLNAERQEVRDAINETERKLEQFDERTR